MAISDKLNASFQAKKQAQDFFTARAKMMPLREDAQRIVSEVQEIIDAGTFDTVDAELKAVGVKAFNVVNQIVAAFDDPDIKAFLDWRP